MFDPLVHALQDKDTYVREAVEEALKKIKIKRSPDINNTN